MIPRDVIIDLDCFFASVEQELRPELRGRPVGIVPVVAESTSCIAASKEAKKFGIKTGTRVREARQLHPDVVLVESRPAIYLEFHRRFLTALEVFMPVAEVMSIDEVWCRLPENIKTPEDAAKFFLRMKETLRAQIGEVVTCSVGMAPNRFLAKLASDMGKPNGFLLIQKADLPHCLHRLKLRDFCGIGRNMERRLHDHGITTVAQLTSASRETLHAVWGSINGFHMYHWLRGEVTELPPTQRRTIGHSHILPTKLRNEIGVRAVSHRLLQKAATRLRKLDMYASGLQAFIKYEDKQEWSREIRFTETQDSFVFLNALEKLWEHRPRKGGIPPQATGVTFAPLIPASRVTPDLLLHNPAHEKICQAMDALNRRLGKNTVTFGGALGALEYAPMRIAFTRIPDQETEG
ncbi:DNA polymerase [Roseimicrobium sp. ORNL1]|uniref:Y-family DNA polymerase n=1 Tax=Roseimicrobium sp. ORNL1 TaxID=2711231 RepID=UPI0013E18B38|nr:DNA polymerase [Roseimicrobium sp. ORNL1]QIF04925.1 DNA polymerase [Roseimicrobium sp. ORNL1]